MKKNSRRAALRKTTSTRKAQTQYQSLEARQLLASFYVDGSVGDDSNNGLSLNTAFATIQAAANEAQAGDTVFVREGVYREQVNLPRSGTADNPITFQAYNNEDVVLSSADLVTGWTRHSGDVWRATVDWNAGNVRDANTLFVNGELQQFARQGAENDFFNINDWGQVPRGRITNGASSVRVNDLGGFSNDYWNGAKIRIQTFDYVVETKTIADFSSNGTITFTSPLGVTSQKQVNGYYIYDTLLALDQPGEWYKDNGNTLYFQVAPGQNPNNQTIEFKRRGFGFNASGRDHIHIGGFEFRGNSIQTNSATDFNVYRNNEFHGYDFQNFGRFIINGTNNTLRDSILRDVWGSAVTVFGSRNSIVNNYIHRVGYSPTARVLSAASAEELLFSHNTVQRYARSFLDGYPSRSEIAYNVFEDGGLLTWDTGVFDSDGQNGNSSNSIVHHNIIRNTNTRGIFLAFYGRNDNLVVHHNVVHDFNANAGLTVFAVVGTEFQQAYHNTVITGTGAAPQGSANSAEAVQTRYNNNLQITTDEVAAIGVDLRGTVNYSPSDFVNFGGRDFRLAAGSDAIDAGIVLPGINDGFVGSAPDAGAFEFGTTPWTAGHNFASPPTPEFDGVSLPGTNLYDNGLFLNGIGDWQIVSGTPNSRDRNSWNLQFTTAPLTGFFRTQSVELTPGEAIRRTFTGLTPNTTYTLGASVRVANQVTNGSDYNAVSGSVSRGSHRLENYTIGLTSGEWARFDNIDFGDPGLFNQLDITHIRDPRNGAPNVDGTTIQIRLDSPTGPLLAEISDLTQGNIGDRWYGDRADFLREVSGVHSIFLSASGPNSQNLGIGSIRLLNDAPATIDLLTANVQTAGGESVAAKIGGEDWYPGYDEISFTTGPTAIAASIEFSNNGRLNAYLDRFYLLSGVSTRGSEPRGIRPTGTLQYSSGPNTTADGFELVDGSVLSSIRTSDDPGSFVRVNLDERAEVHSIRILPNLFSPTEATNFRVSIWSADPDAGGVELWTQDYLTDNQPLGPAQSLAIQADTFGQDGSTRLGDVAGRVVQIQSLGTNAAGNHRLSFAEVEVLLFDVNNLAVTDGLATQSTTDGDAVATRAIDGDPSTPSATRANTTNSWWQVKLSQPISIGEIELVNHDGSNFNELSNFTVSVWNEDPNAGGARLWQKSYFQSGSVSQGGSLIIDGSEVSDNGFLRLASVFTGKYIRVQLNGTNNAGNGRLSLADVRVAGSNTAAPSLNLAQQGIADQSDDFYGIQASLFHTITGRANVATDGIIQPFGDITSTPPQTRPWWQVELPRTVTLDQIVLYNRAEAGERLDNFTVSVWNDDPSAGGSRVWSRNYGFSSNAGTYSTSSIGPGGALVINGNVVGNEGRSLSSVENARYVRVQLNGTNILSLIEAQVWEKAPEVLPPDIRTVDLSQTTYRYDLGPRGDNAFFDNTYEFLSSEVAGDIYWTSPVQGVRYGDELNALNRDGILKLDGPSTLEHKIADGIWQVLVTVGDSETALDDVSISAEGQVFKSGINRSAGVHVNEIFSVAVSDGSLSLEIADNGGSNSLWSISRVILTRVGDLPDPPTVLASTRDGGAASGFGLSRPDLLNSVSVLFDQNVNVDVSDLRLYKDVVGGTEVSTDGVTLSYNASQNTATWNFSGITSSLDYGYYAYQLSDSITSASTGLSLQPPNGQNSYSDTIYVALPGDTNLDGKVDVLGDATVLVSNLGTTSGATWAQGDFNGDGKVDILGDGFALVNQLGASVLPPAAAPSSSFVATGPEPVIVASVQTEAESESAVTQVTEVRSETKVLALSGATTEDYDLSPDLRALSLSRNVSAAALRSNGGSEFETLDNIFGEPTLF